MASGWFDFSKRSSRSKLEEIKGNGRDQENDLEAGKDEGK